MGSSVGFNDIRSNTHCFIFILMWWEYLVVEKSRLVGKTYLSKASRLSIPHLRVVTLVYSCISSYHIEVMVFKHQRGIRIIFVDRFGLFYLRLEIRHAFWKRNLLFLNLRANLVRLTIVLLRSLHSTSSFSIKRLIIFNLRQLITLSPTIITFLRHIKMPSMN